MEKLAKILRGFHVHQRFTGKKYSTLDYEIKIIRYIDNIKKI